MVIVGWLMDVLGIVMAELIAIARRTIIPIVASRTAILRWQKHKTSASETLFHATVVEVLAIVASARPMIKGNVEVLLLVVKVTYVLALHVAIIVVVGIIQEGFIAATRVLTRIVLVLIQGVRIGIMVVIAAKLDPAIPQIHVAAKWLVVADHNAIVRVKWRVQRSAPMAHA
jgi:hypothetical protein